ncbi:MAG: restriction endonuclease subunit S, partial [Candidatus Riflebacteria bacterium]|nr:restriction endonuclease subunit S [Candidatus Riflebacteria bacterium]
MSWGKKTLKHVLICCESGSRPKGGLENVEEVKEGYVPSLGAEHLSGNGGFNFTNLKTVNSSFYEGMKTGKIQRNDVLIVKDGATTGKTSFVDENFPYTSAGINEHIFCLRANPEIIFPRFLFYFLASNVGNQ